MIKLDSIDLWIQVHVLADGYFPLLKSLAAKVGEFVYAEPKSPDFEGNLFRVRVKINVHKQLEDTVSLKKERKRQIFKIKFVHLLDWCAIYGHLEHLYKEHRGAIHAPSALVFQELKVA